MKSKMYKKFIHNYYIGKYTKNYIKLYLKTFLKKKKYNSLLISKSIIPFLNYNDKHICKIILFYLIEIERTEYLINFLKTKSLIDNFYQYIIIYEVPSELFLYNYAPEFKRAYKDYKNRNKHK